MSTESHIADPRTEGLLQIRTEVGTSTLGVWPHHERVGQFWSATEAFVDATERLASRAADLKSAPIGVAERDQRTRTLANETLASAEAAAEKLSSAGDILRQQIADATPLSPWRDTPYPEVATTLAMADHMRALSPLRRAALVAQMKIAPSAHMDYLSAVVQLPCALTGIDPTDKAAITQAAFAAANPTFAKRLSIASRQHGVALESARALLATARRLGANVPPSHALARLAETQPARY